MPAPTQRVRAEHSDIFWEYQGKRQRIAEMVEFLKEQSIELQEYDEQLVRRLVEKITVVDDHLEVGFKSGVEFNI